MIEIHYSKKGTPFVWASDLRDELKILTDLKIWFPKMIEYGFEPNEDYFRVAKSIHSKTENSNIIIDWAVQLDMAKHIAVIQRSDRGKKLRQHLINLDKKFAEGKLLSQEQIDALFDLCEVLGFFSVQKNVENSHYRIFDKKAENWWKYRAKTFGYSSQDLKEIMKGLNKRYKNQRQALMNIDKLELIRISAFDLMKAMRKSDEYATNVSKFARTIAERMEIEVYNDINMSIDFKSPKQKKTIEVIKIATKENKAIEAFKN